MFDYISQMNAFNERCQITGLAPTVRVVYYTLLDMNNRLFWVSSFKTTIRIIADRSGVNKNGVAEALRTLKNEGYIQYTPSKTRGTGSTISICPLYGTQTGTQNGTQTGTNCGTDSGTKQGTQTGTLKRLKTDKDKQDIKKRTPKKFIPPTLEEIEAYCQENNFSVKPLDFYNYFKDTDWIDSKGQKVVSWKGTIRTWEKYQAKGGSKNEPEMGSRNGGNKEEGTRTEGADSFREECRRADANQIYPWEVQNPA